MLMSLLYDIWINIVLFSLNDIIPSIDLLSLDIFIPYGGLSIDSIVKGSSVDDTVK
jgi:hypothetical protein